MAVNLEKIFKACGFLKVDNELANDINNIIDWQKKLLEINIDGVEEMFTTIGDNEKYIYNEDVEKISNDDIFSNAPEKEDNFFLVPKVIKVN